MFLITLKSNKPVHEFLFQKENTRWAVQRRLHHFRKANKMKKEIQYQIQPWISEFVDYFWSCKKSVNSYEEDDFLHDCISGIPTKLSNKLCDYILDIICGDDLYYLLHSNNTKKKFAKKIIKLISNGLIVVK